MAGLDPAISIGMVADWDCIVRKLAWAADGRVKPWVKPGHDGIGKPGHDGLASPAMTGWRVDPNGPWYHMPEGLN